MKEGPGSIQMRALSVWAALTLAACVTDQTPQPATTSQAYPDLATIKAERDVSTKAYVLCLASAAKRLDDGRSDPGTIAHAMISACAKEFDANVEV